MNQRLYLWSLGALSLVATSCATHYQMTGITHSRILIDKRYDVPANGELAQFMAPYQHEVDSIMRPVVGRLASNMVAHRPESKLSNLLSDILLWGAAKYHEKADFAVYNMGGIRAALTAGEVTFGDVVDVAPFENKICLVTLSGAKVRELFAQMAMRGGEGVSHGVELQISRDGKLVSALVNGKPIDDNAQYRISTLDYVAHGNDQMTAFKSATDILAPENEQDNVRFLIVDYLREQSRRGVVVDREVEGRIKIVE